MSYMLSCVLQADWGEERCQSMYVNQIHVEREAEASGKSKLLEPPYSTTRSLLLHRIKRWENFFVFFVFAKPRLVHGIKNFYLSSWWLYVISVDLKRKFFLFCFFCSLSVNKTHTVGPWMVVRRILTWTEWFGWFRKSLPFSKCIIQSYCLM